jgi:hypothetical protein
MFTSGDIEQITQKGIPLQLIEKQITHFIKGFPFINLVKPAIPGDGIVAFKEERKNFYIHHFNETAPHNRIVKFVPASGAASRMFKHLFEFREKYKQTENDYSFYLSDKSFNSVYYLITHISEIAFYTALREVMHAHGLDLKDAIDSKDLNQVIDNILEEDGLNYSNLPKGLIQFHTYRDHSRTAAEEHLVEAANYARDQISIARIHFTISPEHQQKFHALIQSVIKTYEKSLGVSFEISYSIQKPGTDIIAVTPENEPFRNGDGTLLFRPGGHGALLENLGEIDADLIFIKNIDNIVPDRLKQITFDYKKLLGGYLLSLREQIFNFLKRADGVMLSSRELDEIACFVKDTLHLPFSANDEKLDNTKKQELLVTLLNRPIRVCGMVRNEGEPGGGPFWVSDDQGKLSLQIVESSQIDMNTPGQADIVKSSTHFNPVDLVCSTRDYHGNPFNLKDFVDEETGFISSKSSGGRPLKAQELPGLWNGAMAKWITVFLEVPIITFNPVKTVNDLLRPEHLGGEL